VVVRNNKWRKIIQYMVPEISKPPLTRRQKDTLLSHIPINLTSLLSTNELMAGAQVASRPLRKKQHADDVTCYKNSIYMRQCTM
jgi:hypothetical protein